MGKFVAGLRDNISKGFDRDSAGVVTSKDGEVEEEVDHDKVAFSYSLQHSLIFV